MPNFTHRILSLGAGVQSSTLLLMACRGEIEKPNGAIFADTGAEPSDVYAWLTFLHDEASQAGIPVIRRSVGNIETEVAAAAQGGKRADNPPFWTESPTGSKGRLRQKCTQHYKIRVIKRGVRELVGIGPRDSPHAAGIHVQQWIGISADEVTRIKPSDQKWITHRFPLIEPEHGRLMTRNDCLEWMRSHGYPRPPKSACIMCPFRSDGGWRDIRDKRPDEWARAVAFDRAIRTGVDGVEHKAYLHGSLMPLDNAPLDGDGQLSLFPHWTGECSGLCNT